MIRAPIRRVALPMVAAAVTLATVTAPATAQLGRLRSVAAKVNPVAGAKVGVVEFNREVLEITGERLALLVRGLEAEQAMARRVDAQDLAAIERARAAAEARHAGERAAYDAAISRHNACVEQNSAGGLQAIQALRPSESEEARLKAVADRIKAAQAAGNTAEVMRLADSMARVGNRAGQAATTISTETQQKVQAACGARPTEPARPVHPRVYTYEDILSAGEEASTLEGRAYRILRERVAPLVLGQSPGGLVYQPGELSAINAAMNSLKPFASLLQRF